ncbi:RNA polymerase sigma-70 factor, ECF subfamily [Chitinophaga jiangningensis]|uniref:RNA polymerase sigma-70 factor, ECF subfamily n=1 Tax=Chitinophaga jiangningensis TaxID=1419482 RepID=A0A1M7HJV6_9BACT|nr:MULTISPECIES: RNA polymerase sigma factor [Chitinophaga]MBV7528994.1 RNA polymerase sigma factor [Chitinophaga sp. sic0106]SHM28603.1 RNA polymerase sigma-70 factor, ECF subfamily [Chitinophaga jiangningensis]
MSSVEFNTLLVGNADFLKPFAYTLTKDNEQAKDLYQETIFRALTNQDKYLEGTNIKAWLFTIMRNIFINNYRKKSKNRMITEPVISDFFINYQRGVVGNSAETTMRTKDVHLAMYKLPVIFKQPFLLYLEGYKYFEIAAILQEPLGTIKSRIHFARKILKTQVQR